MTGLIVASIGATIIAAATYVILSRLNLHHEGRTPRRQLPLSLIRTVIALLAVSAYVILRALLGMEVTP